MTSRWVDRLGSVSSVSGFGSYWSEEAVSRRRRSRRPRQVPATQAGRRAPTRTARRLLRRARWQHRSATSNSVRPSRRLEFGLTQPLYLETFDENDNRHGSCTGFLVRYRGRHVLLTAWHCLARRNYFTGADIGENFNPVASVSIRVATASLLPGFQPRVSFRVNVLQDDGFTPRWVGDQAFQNPPRHLSSLPISDVAAVEVRSTTPGSIEKALFRRAIGLDQVAGGSIPVGDLVAIPGFPYSFSATGGNPVPEAVVRTGFIASRRFPFYSNAFMIDVPDSAPGMSGAPVWISDARGRQWVLGLYSGAFRVSAIPGIDEDPFNGLRAPDSDDPELRIAWGGQAIFRVVQRALAQSSE